MPNNSELTDYERLNRPSGRSVREQPEAEGDWQKVRGAKANVGAKGRLSTSGFGHPIPALAAGGIPRSSVASKSLPQVSERPVIKRGHALSYAGLFLFTFMVYFRPYELFPGLAWLSKSTFWIGIITLAVFIP